MNALPRLILAAVSLLAAPGAAATQTAYRCTDAQGRIAFQDRPCRRDEQSHAFEYQRQAPASAAQVEIEPEPVAPAPPAAMPAPPPPRPPVPTVYRCVRADNEQIYYSETGETASYLAPAAVVGLGGGSAASATQPSAPEIGAAPVRTDPAAAALGSAYVEVRDRCERLVPAEACRALRGQLDDNLARQRSVGKDERVPLAEQARALAEKLAGC